MWSSLKLKYDEADYFLSQLKVHVKHPKIFLFYLSAFLSSARSVTFHLQKQAASQGKTDLYRQLQRELLSDKVCQFFIDARNQTEKESYLQLSLFYMNGMPQKPGEKPAWMVRAIASITIGSNEPFFKYIDEILERDWDCAHRIYSSHGHYQEQFVWMFKGYPTGTGKAGYKKVLSACEEYLDRLWALLVKFRIQLDQAFQDQLGDREQK
ncbi:hypothetical protein [Chroococcidiopsis thermalis]|uniref:Uncharacterized protein n=1 Tax=Chroococcidiopsis thermalis (strain PCC 7203) TaxID=251229 RepID=K9TVI8_CHRTP|nr:hypothetical protein [Chroococcidiopsis thermalis]AFY86585.1 hypothetical protein Chro_1053 [Chroococcidiopsis thermalis PCC 7203]